MPTDHRAELAKIKRFDQLIAYLRDEMGWPIARDSFEDVDDLFYDFTADELGIDSKTAAKIQEIKRLRPLSSKQPWGIFFIKFEPKRLPVVALRRILSQVALKKRPTANSAERTAWAADDLLFISNYGEGDERQISFAHFSRPEDGNDLPTLRVLGWNNLNTALHLDDVAEKLTQNLAWPNDSNVDAWRKNWRAAFTLGHREVVTTSKQLSIRLAELAKHIRDRITSALSIETDRGPLTSLMSAFRETLIHDLKATDFADMYAQTIAYGLLTARVADPHRRTSDDFAAHMRTNPFLRELMETFLKVGGRRGKVGGPEIDFDELGVSEVVELLDEANMDAVVRDFGDRNPQEDPVIHFYEHFLAAYDNEQKVKRGVFYTPRPVVAYIVRSADEMLRTEFGLADGLADTTTWGEIVRRRKELLLPDGVSTDHDFVQILDPATGTGTFLVEVIDLIHKTLVDKWKALGHTDGKISALWNDYVPKHLLTRLHGYELLMAPYAIAHLKIGLKLYETGYLFASEQRARVYLTNALEPAQEFSGTFEFAIPALAHESQAVSEIKRQVRFTVVIGNPPYSRSSANTGEYAESLVVRYKAFVREERNIQPLSDDYIKFIGLGQHILNQSRAGVFGMITNNTYLTGRIHRGVRRVLLDLNSTVCILNLHGSGKVAFLGTDREGDENVFDILQGVAISVMAMGGARLREREYAELTGRRANKYQRLVDGQLDFSKLFPTDPYFLLVPQLDSSPEYEAWPSLSQIVRFQSVSGKPGDDDLLVQIDRDAVIPKLKEFKRQLESGNVLVEELTEAARKFAALSLDRFDNRKVIPYAYRPFDTRYTYYDPRIWTRPLERLKACIDGSPVLLASKLVKDAAFAHVFVTRAFPDVILLSNTSSVNCYAFPGHVPADAGELGLADNKSTFDTSTFSASLRKRVSDEDALSYVYALLHAPTFRSRYLEPLRLDFPRIPIARHEELFNELSVLGGKLMGLHLLESKVLDTPLSKFVGTMRSVSKVGWTADGGGTVWIDGKGTIKDFQGGTSGFSPVPEAVWNFRIGSYQVCGKWLKDRTHRTLSDDDLSHYNKVVVALAQTIIVMHEIDAAVGKHGGWPAAFHT